MKVTKKICARCDKEKDFKEFNAGLASHGLKRVCMSCEEDLSIYYKKQQSEAERVVCQIEQNERLKQLRKNNKNNYDDIVKYLKARITFLKEKKNGEYQTALQIIQTLQLMFPKGIVYKALSENALKGRSNGTARYYIKYKDI